MLELFDQVHRTLTYLGASDEELRGDGNDVERLLVHSGMDVFWPHWRQPDLLSARAERRP